jgi:hypothetical protein
MIAFFKKYKEAMRLKHGWEVELVCSQCGHCGVPAYNGWTSIKAISLGNTPLIYANVSCSECGNGLKQEAGTKVIELFSKIPVPSRNKIFITWFVACMTGIPLILTACIYLGVRTGFWGVQSFTTLSFMVIAIGPAIMFFNYKISSIRRTCDCGSPAYTFMGLLGRSYCFRCSSCGRLLRMRD